MSWTLLVVAGVLEIAFAFGMKWSAGFSRFWPSVYAVATGLSSIVLLTLSLRALPVGTAYAVWTGIGAAGTAMLGMVLFGESRDTWRMLSLLFIIAGIVGLKVSST